MGSWSQSPRAGSRLERACKAAPAWAQGPRAASRALGPWAGSSSSLGPGEQPQAAAQSVGRRHSFHTLLFCVWVECSWGGPFGGDGFSPPRRIFWSQESNCLGFCRRPPWLGALTPFLDGNALGAPSQNTSEIPGRKRPWRSWHSRPGKFWPFPAGKGLAIPGRERSGHSRPGKVWAFPAGKGLGIPGRERSGHSRPGKVGAFPAGKTLATDHFLMEGNHDPTLLPMDPKSTCTPEGSSETASSAAVRLKKSSRPPISRF